MLPLLVPQETNIPNIHRIKSQDVTGVYGVLSPAGESSELQPASRKSPVSSNFSALTSVSTCASSNRGRGERNALRSQQGGQKAQSVLGRKEDVSTKNRGFFQRFKMIACCQSPDGLQLLQDSSIGYLSPEPMGEPIGVLRYETLSPRGPRGPVAKLHWSWPRRRPGGSEDRRSEIMEGFDPK